MTAAHEPSMDDILKSIRRIIRSDQDETSASIPKVESDTKETSDELTPDVDDNLIKMEIQDQKRVRILEKKLQTLELEYEQKLALHRRKMSEYRQQNKELVAVVDDCKSKLKAVTDSLKSAHDCLEKMDADNKMLNDSLEKMDVDNKKLNNSLEKMDVDNKKLNNSLEKMDADNKKLNDRMRRMRQEERGSVVLKTIQKEFVELYHPERSTGDPISKAVRQEIYNEFSQVLKGVKSRFQISNA